MSDIADEYGHVTPDALVKGFAEIFGLMGEQIIEDGYTARFYDLLAIYKFLEDCDKRTGMAVLWEGITLAASLLRMRHNITKPPHDAPAPTSA